MFLNSAANRLKRHLVEVPDSLTLRLGPAKDEYKGWIKVLYNTPSFPWLSKPDFVSTDAGAILLRLGKYKYIIEKV